MQLTLAQLCRATIQDVGGSWTCRTTVVLNKIFTMSLAPLVERCLQTESPKHILKNSTRWQVSSREYFWPGMPIGRDMVR